MLVLQAPFVIFFIMASTHISFCAEKGSLVYVIDTTGSMIDDIAQVKQSTNVIIKKVFEEKASQIRNMMIVTFNDPDAALDTITEDRNVYESKLSELTFLDRSGGDCPEMSMEGLLIALENSLPGSFIYLFTDASAKDHYKKDNIIKMCQEKKSQIVFVLTGHCDYDYWLPPFQVYYEIAAACSGVAIHVNKYEISGIFGLINDAITDRKEEITSKSIPANTIQEIAFEIDEQTEYITITAAGDNVQLLVRGPMATTTWWTYRKKQLTWLNNFKVLKLTSLTPGRYKALVRGTSVTTIKIVGKSDFTFDYGFSKMQPKSLKDTSAQPTADSSTHLVISVSDPNHSMDILSAQILGINENIIKSDLTLERISGNIYWTPSFIAPAETFKIAILGRAINTGRFIRHLARFPITSLPMKQKPAVTILEGKSVEVEYGQSLQLTCKVTAYPEPNIQWMENGSQRAITSEISVMELVVYTSYLTIPEAIENKTYICYANNEVESDKKQIEVNVKSPFEVNSPLKDKTEVKYGREVTLKCDIKTLSTTQSMYIVWLFKDKKSFSWQQIGKSDKYSLSADNSVLTIKSMTLDMVGTYNCTAILKGNKNQFISHSTQVNLIGLTLPKITSGSSMVYKGIEGYDKILKIPCTATGIPEPTISWKARQKTIMPNAKYALVDGALVIRNPIVSDTGTYMCHAKNVVGSVNVSFHVEILQEPQISGEASMVATAGTSTNIICNITKGMPIPILSWKFMAKGESNYVEIAGSDNKLHLIKISQKDAGRYKCVARNKVGDAEHVTALNVQASPKITSKPSVVYKSVKGQDTSLRIPCMASGLPTPIISWTLNHKPIKPSRKYSLEGDTLVINFPDVNDTGMYVCKATNDVGSVDATFPLEVLLPPSIKSDSSITFQSVEGQDKVLRIPCTTIGLPKPTITWKVRQETLESNTKYSLEDESLLISEPTVNDTATYVCIATNDAGSVNASFQAEIFQVPKVLGESLLTVTAGTSTNIKCKIIGGVPSPTISWLFSANSESKFVQLADSESELRILMVREEDAGRYKCVVHNNVGIDEHVTVLNIQVSPSIKSESSIVYKSVEGQDKLLRIPCTAIGFPKPTITWKVRNETIIPNTKYYIEDGALIIKEPTVNDTGTYICVATNDVGAVSAYFNTKIIQRPHISGEVSTATVKAGTSTIIICNITKSVPAPTISWQFMAKGESKFVQLAGSDNELRISRIGERDAGLYKCVAHNDVADVEHITELVVEFAPYITTNRSATYEGIEGDVALVMPCDAHGVPTPVISWLCNDTDITTAPKYSMLSDGALIIKDPKTKDTGSYTCVATNTFGSVHSTFEAEVKQHVDEYGTIDEVFIDVTKQTSYRLECGLPGQSVTWFTENLGDTNVTGNYYQLYDIEDSLEVNYTCRVSDTHGAYTKTFVVQANTPPKFQFEQQGPSFDWTGRDKVLLDCTLSNGYHTNVEWTYNGKVLSDHNSMTMGVEGKWGAYTCNVSSHFGTVQRSFNVSSLSPSIKSDSSIVYKSVEGQDKLLRIPCTAIGFPKPTITWKVRNETIIPNTKYYIEDGALIIKEPTVNDTGTYICVATNDVGTVSAYFNTKIIQGPHISGEVSTATVKAGTSTIIICNITKSVPAPTISWQFMAKGESKFVQLAGSDNELRISRIGERDAGLYKCVAHNDVADVEHITELVVEFAPYITTNRSATYEGIEGDVALVMPCDAHGVPTPVISWLCNDTDITTAPKYSMLSDGALIIKDPKTKDTGSYTCVATNTFGSVHSTFEAEVKQHVDEYGTIDEVFIDVTKQTSYRLECGLPGQSVTWFTENLGDTNVTGNYYQLYDIEDSLEVNYTCRVSDTHGAYTKTFVVQANTPPKFQFEQQGPSFDWTGSDKDLLDCTLSNGYHTHVSFTDKVEWTYNGKVLSDHISLTLGVEGKWGAYTCNVSSHFGTVQRSFNVVSSECLISRNLDKYEAMPLILSENSTWPRLKIIGDYFKAEPGTKLKFACPNNEAIKNKLKMFPVMNEIMAICVKQDIFTFEGKPYKVSDFECNHPVTPSVIKENVQCAVGPTESLRVGYNTSTSNFLQTYQICFDTLKNLPIYSLEWMPNNNSKPNVEYNWYRHPAVDFRSNDKLYTCKNSTSTCCYNKTQLISTRAFSDSVAQTSTFIDPINAVPVWLPCDEYESPWESIEKKIRSRLKWFPVSVIWSGTHIGDKQNGFDVPRYLFKLVEFRDEKSIAIVYVNGPTPTAKDVLCKNTFREGEVSWLQVLSDHVYLCDGEEFRKAFKFDHHKHTTVINK